MGKLLITLFVLVISIATALSQADNAIIPYQAELENDTISAWGGPKGFSILKLLTGGRFSINDRNSIRIISPILTLNYNTVEGFNSTIGIRYDWLLNPNSIFSIGPDVRFAVARRSVSAIAHMGYQFEKQLNSRSLKLRAGRAIRQFNEDIDPFANTFMTLLFQQNNLKLFEQDFVNIMGEQNFKEFISIGFDVERSQRWELFNLPGIVDGREYLFSPNAPDNIAINDSSFPRHNAFIASLSMRVRPWLRYATVNGKRQPIYESSPAFRIIYEKGFSSIFGSHVDFDNLTIGIDHVINLGISARMTLHIETGIFLNTNRLYFMDFFHFPRNQAPFLLAEHDQTFRLLPYYRFSTPNRYFKSNFDHQMQRFLLTRIPLLQVMGIKENLILNNLFTPDIDHYAEFGYGIDYILQALRLEFMTSFLNGGFDGFGVRLGLQFVP
jgi:hypothetical protein